MIKVFFKPDVIPHAKYLDKFCSLDTEITCQPMLVTEQKRRKKQDACPDQWICLSGGCYHFLTERLSWGAAKEACEKLPGSGRLAEIETE